MSLLNNIFKYKNICQKLLKNCDFRDRLIRKSFRICIFTFLVERKLFGK